jgi:hypothetical protein
MDRLGWIPSISCYISLKFYFVQISTIDSNLLQLWLAISLSIETEMTLNLTLVDGSADDNASLKLLGIIKSKKHPSILKQK